MASSTTTTPPTAGQGTLPDGYKLAPDKSHAVFTKGIESSANDNRSYRLVLLNNGLEVLLIHDKDTDKSAAALSVHVGHLSDPDNLQGLAHYLEHLLFLGTSKYPRENDYKEYLSLHSGRSNASTGLELTQFYFEIANAFLEGALDRFAQFFISPAFNESSTDRELRAVDSEFKRNLQMDTRRLFQLGKHLSSRENPYWHFSTGNLITLRELPQKDKINVREELIKFYHKYYSANIMKLVILGQEPLDQLTKWAVEKFSDVKNLDIEPPSYSSPPLTENEFLKTVYAKPVMDTKSLEIKFLYGDEIACYTTPPSRYISFLLGHEGPGSILSLLKNKGWANGLSASVSDGGIGNAFMKINVDLTDEGLVHHEDVTVIVFQYIEMMRREGVKDYIWFEAIPAATYVTDLVSQLQMGYAPEHVISGPALLRGAHGNLVSQYLDKYMTVDSWVGRIVTQNKTIVPGNKFTDKEQWYGTEYHVQDTSPSLIQRLKAIEPNPELHFPAPNDFIPKNFEVNRPSPDPTPLLHPTLLKQTTVSRIWHKKDDTFWIPKVHLYFQIRSPVSSSTPRNKLKSMLFAELIQDNLSESAYAAQVAGLNFSVASTNEGLVIKVEGYNDKAALLLNTVVEQMKTFDIDPSRFSRVKDLVQRNERNRDQENPRTHAEYFMTYLNEDRQWTYHELLDELDQEDITLDEMKQFHRELLSRLHIEGLIHGNMNATEAIEAGAIVENGFSARAVVPSELIARRSNLLPDRLQAVYQRPVANADNLNSGIEYYLQIGASRVPTRLNITEVILDRALVQIMAQIIQEPCFNQLRTKEQLGYIVTSGVRKHHGSFGIKIVVQSERDPIYLESRIEALLETRIRELLESMTSEEYERHVQSVKNRKLEKDKNLMEETTRYWSQIWSGFYEFDEREQDVDAMNKTTVEMARMFFQEWLRPLPDPASVAAGGNDGDQGPSHSSSENSSLYEDPWLDGRGSRTKKLSVHIRSQKLPPSAPALETPDKEEVKLKSGTTLVKDVAEFKSGLEL
ncbi:Insulinase (Peptidase M16), partial [Lunasporangiospora selenospora]